MGMAGTHGENGNNELGRICRFVCCKHFWFKGVSEDREILARFCFLVRSCHVICNPYFFSLFKSSYWFGFSSFYRSIFSSSVRNKNRGIHCLYSYGFSYRFPAICFSGNTCSRWNILVEISLRKQGIFLPLAEEGFRVFRCRF